MLNLKVSQVDLLDRSIRLERGDTKNGEAKTVSLTAECYQLVSQMVRGKRPEDYLLTRANGKRVKDFRETWDALVADAGLPWLLLHDLRRSSVSNMIRRGVPERVAMEISGHKTRSVFERYNIVNKTDLRDAARKLEAGAKAELERAAELEREIPTSFPLAPIQGCEEVRRNDRKPS